MLLFTDDKSELGLGELSYYNRIEIEKQDEMCYTQITVNEQNFKYWHNSANICIQTLKPAEARKNKKNVKIKKTL